MNDNYRLHYHIEEKQGWINDPNGFSFVDGVYYIYFQYAYEAKGGLKHWKLKTTTDFKHYQDYGIVLSPDSKDDKSGAYSGSCLVYQNKRYYFYTGNVKHEGNYDYINKGREHNTICVTSRDGIHLENKHVVLRNSDYPENMSCHVRDPYVFQDKDCFMMLLGARTLDSQGCFLLYTSSNLEDWSYQRTLDTKEKFGYMWECPNYLEFKDNSYIFACPQGLEENNYDFEAVYQNGYFRLTDTLSNQGEIEDFYEFDLGFDFYAPQFLKRNDDYLMIGWMGLPDIPYDNLTIAQDYQHALTMVRKIQSVQGHLVSYPVEDYKQLRLEHFKYQTNNCIFKNLQFEFHIQVSKECQFYLRGMHFIYHDHLITIDMTSVGAGRGCKHIKIKNLHKISIFSDQSSLEIFFNDGEKSFTTRIYDDSKEFKSDINYQIEGYYLDSIILEKMY